MSKKRIKLTIQEIIEDFESLVRYDERLDVNFDFGKADQAMVRKFYADMVTMTRKYIPNYEAKVDPEYFSEPSSYERGLMLYKMLYENFREIFCSLI